ncbi:MAG: DUF4286 family protein [Phycisphaerales bacterium]|nr:DUF4286 family protein [Phycisphaerales bacterium]
MSDIAYTVTCTFTEGAVADEWVVWLRDEHLADVFAGGATEAEIVRCDDVPDGAAARLEVRYRFPSRSAFEAYVRDHAPRTRAAGLARFPLERGLSYGRSVGVVIVSSRAG